jgi:L-ascorbate metabolism protein UlaG (beta-lactamase superfamily)
LAADILMSAPSLSITWLGHSAFLLGLPSGQRIAFDPWLENPMCPPGLARPEAVGPLDLILVSHGHDDHASSVAALSRATRAPVVCLYELGLYLSECGIRNVLDMGVGGTRVIDGLSVSMVPAAHTGSARVGGQLVYLGGAAGFVLQAKDMPTIYYAGDTGLFGDMRMIREVYTPEIAFLPIGGVYTMGPELAAIAARWLGVRQVVPMHWGTFPALTGRPSELRAHLGDPAVDVLDLAPGETAQ